MSPLFFTFTVPSLWKTARMLHRLPTGHNCIMETPPLKHESQQFKLVRQYQLPKVPCWANPCELCPTPSSQQHPREQNPRAGQVLNWPFPLKVPIVGKKGREFIYPLLVERDWLSIACLLFLDVLFHPALFILYSTQPPNSWYLIEPDILMASILWYNVSIIY